MTSTEPARMRIAQITPGAGEMYCGACMRDNALVQGLRRLGHSVTMIPLYLPLTLDEPDQSAGTPTFYGGINVYLDQQSALFRRAPLWLHHLLNAPALLRMAAGRAARTRPESLGEITLSMLRGEEGNQARELDELIAWLRHERPSVICLSNVLLAGMARRLRAELRAPVLCSLQGEDWFLDSLPPTSRELAWQTVAERAEDVDLFIAPSRYFAELMQKRLGLKSERVRILHNGIHLEGFQSRANSPSPPTLGYFARMCREKGLENLVEAFLVLKKRDRVKQLRLRVGGSCGPADQPLVDQLRGRLAEAGVAGEAEFVPNPTREEKLRFLSSLSVFSVPAQYSEPFGLYVVEALAAGVPVVLPNRCAFPELIAATGGGVLCEPGDPRFLADALESLLADPERARALGATGRQAVLDKFSANAMAAQMAAICAEAIGLFSNS